MATVEKQHSIDRFHKYLMKIVVLLQGVNNLVTLCKMNLVKGNLILLFLLPCAHADRSLSILLEGTPQTPAISGLQITTIKGGEVLEHFAFGVAQTGTEGDVLAPRSQNSRRVRVKNYFSDCYLNSCGRAAFFLG